MIIYCIKLKGGDVLSVFLISLVYEKGLEKESGCHDETERLLTFWALVLVDL